MVQTLPQLVLNTFKTYPKDAFMLVKTGGEYTPISTDEFSQKVKFFSLGLREIGFRPGDKLIILSENRPEWVMTDLAVQCAGGITVPVYTSLMPEAVRYIIDDSDATIVVVSALEQWKKVEDIRPQLKKVKHFVMLDAGHPADVFGFNEILEKGRTRAGFEPGLFEKEAMAIKPESVASIIYTSGTTGVPKGVLLTHSNFVSNVTTSATALPFTSADTVLSFLPLSHVLERMVMFTYFHVGATIAFAESIETVAQNLLEVRPTVMVSVPRVFEKIYSKVLDNVLTSSALKKRIFFWAVKVGREYGRRKLDKAKLGAWLRFRKGLAHKLVFSKVIAKTGGRIRFFVSGGAPLSKDIAEFFYALGLYVMEGYGLTETSPVISINTFENLRFGTVGKPIRDVEVKIAADGEILARGPNIMKGYYKKEAETKEVFENGWFKTGDVGYIDEDGFLVITDRKKDIIVTAGGKNIAPQPIENILKTNPYISSAVVIGDRRRFLSALIVPNFEKLEAYAKQTGVEARDRSQLVSDARIVQFLMDEVDKATPGLASYEKIKKLILLDRDFEIEKDEITPSMKVRRNIIEDKYRQRIDALYKEDRES